MADEEKLKLSDPNGEKPNFLMLASELKNGGERRGSRFKVDVVDESPSSPKTIPSPVKDDPAAFYNNAYIPAPEEEIQAKTIEIPIFSIQDESAPNVDSKYDDRKISSISYGNVQTVDRPPNIHHYRNANSIAGAIASRPTLQELRAGALLEEIVDEDEFELGIAKAGKTTGNVGKLERLAPPNTVQPVKFGWIQGVLIRCVLNIVGVMLYLRLSWIGAQAGIGLTSLIILLSSSVTCITTLSMCAICTNGEVKGGGAYFMISRSLGAEFGGSIGVIFTLANLLGAAMYIVGFGETVRDLLEESNACIVGCGTNDIRIIGWCTGVLLMAIVFVGVSFEAKAQLVLLVILLVSLVNYYVGTVLPLTDEVKSKGFTGYTWATMTANFVPDFRGGETFFTLLGIYFPSATGIMAGANISGDLKEPSKAIPRGTLLAIFLTTLLYLSVVWTTGATCIRDASGSVADLINGNLSECASTGSGCQYGLMNYYHIMEVVSGYKYLITAGIFAATLSSALACLVSAPRVFQAVSRDRLYPYTHHLAQGYGKSDEPRRLYVVCFAIVMLVVSLGNLNIIAPYVSNFFLASYCLVNYACFDASFSKSPGFRPSFRYYNMWISLLGAFLCVVMMFVMNYIAAIVTLAFVFLLYVYVWRRRPDVNWGSSNQAAVYKAALQKAQKLQNIEDHVKNYRPQILVLSGNPVARPSLVDFAANVTKDISFLACGHVILMNPSSRVLNSVTKLHGQVVSWLKKRQLKAFYYPIVSNSFLSGVQSLLQLCGLSRIHPNIILLGYKNNWTSTLESTHEQVVDYFRVINQAFEAHMGLGILRVAGGLDLSDPMDELQIGDAKTLHLPEPSSMNTLPEFDDDADEEGGNGLDRSASANNVLSAANSTPKPGFRKMESASSTLSKAIPNRLLVDKPVVPMNGSHLSVRMNESRPSLADIASLTLEVRGKKSAGKTEGKRIKQEQNAAPRQSVWSTRQQELILSINRFRDHEKKATIDVYWLFDDGGLTLFVPHMLTLSKSYLEGAKLRVFTIANRKHEIEQEQRSMAALLSKFRIDYSDVYVIPDITKKPEIETLRDFERLIKPFKVDVGTSQNPELAREYITDAELHASQQKTYRQLRTRELLLQHSSDASLVVLTLPVPRQGTTSPFLYMAWLEMLTRDMPPILLLRGNQQSVLTFYS